MEMSVDIIRNLAYSTELVSNLSQPSYQPLAHGTLFTHLLQRLEFTFPCWSLACLFPEISMHNALLKLKNTDE
jgi:hypothetical protein